MLREQIVILLAIGASAVVKPKCVQVHKDLPPASFAKQITMNLADGLMLSGNDMGINNHMTSLKQCSFVDEATGHFGWYFDRQTTEPDCGNPPNPKTQCPYQKCYYQFGFHKVQYGINAWGIPSSTSKMTLPVDISKLKHLNMDVEVRYNWTDVKPVSSPPVYRSRFIYDFFITSEEPKAHSMKTSSTITDEIVIDIGHNDQFMLPCGYKPGQSADPLVRNIIPGFDLMDIEEYDKPSPTAGPNRMTHFRRQNSTCAGNGKPCNVLPNLDLMEIINKVRVLRPESRQKKMGTWLGSMELGTEIYDDTRAEVVFSKFAVQPVHMETIV